MATISRYTCESSELNHKLFDTMNAINAAVDIMSMNQTIVAYVRPPYCINSLLIKQSVLIQLSINTVVFY